jgi:hypothetical protein
MVLEEGVGPSVSSSHHKIAHLGEDPT